MGGFWTLEIKGGKCPAGCVMIGKTSKENRKAYIKIVLLLPVSRDDLFMWTSNTRQQCNERTSLSTLPFTNILGGLQFKASLCLALYLLSIGMD
jgi:hypothetical protein